MYKVLLLLLIINSYCIYCFSQEMEISGQVLSSDNKEILPYAIIEYKKHQTGVYSDENGLFKIKIDNLNDTLDISYVGYEKVQIPAHKIAQNSKHCILLNKNTYKLNDIIVTKKDVMYLTVGATKRKAWSYQASNIFGSQIGKYIVNPTSGPGFIKSVSFYIASTGFPNAPFRVRVYSFDKENKCPGEDLLTENIVVSSKNKSGWFKVDLLKYSIDFPKEGVFIVMEWIYSGDQYYYTKE